MPWGQQLLSCHAPCCMQQQQTQAAAESFEYGTMRRYQRSRKQKQLRVLDWAATAVLLLCQPAAAWRDVVLDLGAGVYNPSLVFYKGSAWVVARSTKIQWDSTGLKWILNRAHLCEVNTTDWSTTSCHDFDPYRGRYGVQCRWGSDDWKVPWEAWGVDDTKLFVWPGRGLWAITGRRPQRSQDSKYCPQVVWRQWLVQLAAEGSTPEPHDFNFPQDEAIPDVTFVSEQDAAAPAAAAAAAAADSGGKVVPRQLMSLQQQQQPSRWWRLLQLGSAPDAVIPQSSDNLPAQQQQQRRRWRPQHSRQRQVLQPGNDDGPELSLPLNEQYWQQQQQQQQQQYPDQQQQQGRHRRRRRKQHRRHRRKAVRPASERDHDLGGPPEDDGFEGWSTGYQSQVLLPALPPQPQQTTVSSSSSSSSNSSRSDPWATLLGAQPVPLHIADSKAVYGSGYGISEKNWMPFVHQGQLFVTYSLAPKHRVYLLHPDGSAEPKHEGDTGDVFTAFGAAAAKVHGGPPMVLVDCAASHALDANSSSSSSSRSSSVQSFYLGVAHYWEPSGKDGRAYKHFLIKVETQPPFKVLKVSRELPLQYNKRYKLVAFVSGLDLVMLPQQQQQQALLQTGQLAGSSSSSSGRMLLAPVPTAAAAAGDSTGSLLADTDSDEFSWSVDPRPSDVNSFSWVAVKGPEPSAKPSPAAKPKQGPGRDKKGGKRGQAGSKKKDEPKEGLLPADPVAEDLHLNQHLNLNSGSFGGLLAAAGGAAGGGVGQLMPHVVVSYGSGDWESRVAVFTLQEMEELFVKQ